MLKNIKYFSINNHKSYKKPIIINLTNKLVTGSMEKIKSTVVGEAGRGTVNITSCWNLGGLCWKIGWLLPTGILLGNASCEKSSNRWDIWKSKLNYLVGKPLGCTCRYPFVRYWFKKERKLKREHRERVFYLDTQSPRTKLHSEDGKDTIREFERHLNYSPKLLPPPPHCYLLPSYYHN